MNAFVRSLFCVLVAVAVVPAPAMAQEPVSVAGLLLRYQDLSRQAEALNEELLKAESVHAGLVARLSAAAEAATTARTTWNSELASYVHSVVNGTSRPADLAAAWSGFETATRELWAAGEAERGSVAALAQRKEALIGQIGAVRGALERLTPDQRALLRGSDGAHATLSVPSGAAGEAVRFALAQLGKPYVWGAEGPGSYDCSGLVQTAYATIGVRLPRVAVDQSVIGAPIRREQVRAGDLIFFYTPVSHVAIAVDQEWVVHAATFGEPVKFGRIDGIGPITAIRRVA